MGGNIFKNTRRYSKCEYENIESEVVLKLTTSMHMSDSDVSPLKYYKNKDSFGDLDVIINSDNLPPNWKQIVIDAFNLQKEQTHSNGNVFSIMYKNFQIDLICMQKKYYESAYSYFAYNDLGNLLGRITHKMGIKLGHKGMSLIIRPSDFNDHVIGEVELSQDFADALRILGLSREEYDKGFNEPEDIFAFVASSPYFNPEIYLLDNRNAASRVRDKKRQTYNKFLDWCETYKDTLRKYDFGTITEKGGYSLREPWYSNVVLTNFPEAEEKVNTMVAEYELNQKLAEKLSGGIVMKVTGVEGKDLGILYKRIKEILFEKYTKEQLISMDSNTIECMVRAIKFCEDNGFKYPYVPSEFAINMIRGNKSSIYEKE